MHNFINRCRESVRSWRKRIETKIDTIDLVVTGIASGIMGIRTLLEAINEGSKRMSKVLEGLAASITALKDAAAAEAASNEAEGQAITAGLAELGKLVGQIANTDDQAEADALKAEVDTIVSSLQTSAANSTASTKSLTDAIAAIETPPVVEPPADGGTDQPTS